MSNENNYEVMDQETAIDVVEDYAVYADETESKSGGKGGAVALVIGGLALGGLAIAGVRKLMKNRTENPKQPKMKMKWVRVPADAEIRIVEVDEEVEDVETDEK